MCNRLSILPGSSITLSSFLTLFVTALEKDKEHYLTDIEKAKEAIRQAELNIEKNDQDQVLAQDRIEKQKQVIETVAEKLRKI